jgi:perosamine synthetase
MVMKPRHPGRISEKALEYLKEVIDYGFGNTTGPRMVAQFEKKFAERIGSRYAMAHCNGTATMHSCLAAAGVKPGDEVIVPPLTAISTAYAVLHQGAIPVFADVDERTFNIDPESIRERITPLTKAIIVVGLYGLSADMDPIMEIAKKHNIIVIEDNAECLLGMYNGKVAGITGHMGSFSLQASKHITCGDGGVVITDDSELATKVRKFACVGYHTLTGDKGGIIPKKERGHPKSIRHDSLGWNYRLSELQGAVALEQVERIDEIVAKRIEIADMLKNVIKDCDFLTPQYTPSNYVNSYWTFVCLYNPEKAGISWDDFRKRFYSFGGDFLYGAWLLSYMEPVFQNRKFLGGGFPIDSEIYKGNKQIYELGLCPVAEKIQPNLMQFKTNYVDMDEAKEQVEALRKTIESLKK